MQRRIFVKVYISYLIVIAAVLSPFLVFSLVRGAGFHDNQRIVEVFCAALSGILVVAYLLRNNSINRLSDRLPICLLALFFSLGAVSGVFAYGPRYAFLEWANFLLLFAMSGLIASELAIKGDVLLDQILRLCGIGCAFYILIEIIIYAALIQHGGQPLNAWFVFGFDNYRFFNHVQTISLPLLGLLVCRNNYSKKNILPWLVVSIWWTLLFVSAGRGTFIGLLAGISVSLFCLRREALPWCRVMLRSALIGMAVYFLFYVLIPLALGLQPFGFLFSVIGRTIENPDSSRWPLWVRAWEIMLAHPWLGAGPLHFAHFGRDVQIGAHPHNWVLQIACEWGIPALFCLVSAIAIGFKSLLATRQYLGLADMKNQATLAAWMAIGVAILVDGLVSGLIVMPTSQLWIALYLGCAWGWVVSIRPAAAGLFLTRSIRIFGVIAMLAAIYFLANGLWPEILNLPLYEKQNLQKELYKNPAYRPRIWLGGFF
ncbi:O-antigen ligase family protein [Collimonas humicola]|uniref:O-antigen ligase family protein n=1 Tax=Collimonas humicola TaxID=2825886 RepID=UPI001B8ACF0A|nr:O-antigen ligase family protein [Collimonas humicola]